LPKPRIAKLESATARRKLAVRKKPYYVRLSPGIAVGYASPVAAETKCTRHLSASDDENLSAGISWLTFLLQSSEQ